jgi:phosphopantothenoylcysteine decarboxylase / phosphopantothenate---cysteine ligase
VTDKKVLLIVGGGVAAYKALELIRLLKKADVGVTPVLTQAGSQFVTPLSLAALAETKTYTDLFSLTDEAEMGHIALSRASDLVVVAPATADLMAKTAHGLADDLASTLILATDKPILMAPAMNVRMWQAPATRRNHATLLADGVTLVGPDEGAMACGEYGPGRMAEPAALFEAIMTMLNGPAARPLVGRKLLVTAGPTHEAIDPVRYIANRSSGAQGYAIAEALARLGAEVTLVSGPTRLETPAAVKRVDVESAAEMLAACEAALPVDGAVMVAAVADWTPRAAAERKLKKTGDGAPPPLDLVKTVDILASLSAPGPRRPRLVVGFAAETSDLDAYAADKLARKGCDLIVGNDVMEDGVMGGAENRVNLYSKEGVERWPRLPKAEVAQRLAHRIAESLQ